MAVLERWHEERQSAWMYRVVAECEPDPVKSRMFLALADAAEGQAEILRGDLEREGRTAPAFAPSTRARFVAQLTRKLGPRRTQHLLAALKVRGLSVYADLPVAGHPMPRSAGEVGASHRRAGSAGTLRAAVFGVNDGLVSNTSLILGVAGASGSHSLILMSGVAGLLAGAFSMGAGEYVSMRSQRELYEFQIGEERAELERYPAEEAEELALIYNARGVPLAQAREMAERLIAHPIEALNTLAREELGLNPDDLGSPWGAAISSFLAFGLGAAVPLVPFAFGALGLGEQRLTSVALLSGLALFAVGAALSLFSGKNAFGGGLRMVAIGACASAATFAIGRLLGAGVEG